MTVMRRTYRHSSLVNRKTGRVRHLLIDELNGNEFTDLIAYEAGGEVKLSSGTEYDIEQAAVQFGQSFVNDEGFEWVAKERPLFEPLEHAVKLAMRLGHGAIFDPTLRQTDLRMPNRNLTGYVLLKDWRGIQAENGGTYKYAVTLGTIIAEPQPAEGYPDLKSGPDFAERLLKAVEAKGRVGSRVECNFATIMLVP
jgi:hypothetical protein